MDIWHYHPVTKEYVGHSKADPDPLNKDGWLVPAHATIIGPEQSPGANETLVFDADAPHWRLVPDHRGETWYNSDGKETVIKDIGDPSLQSFVKEAPPPPDITIEQVKEEAQRRILLFCPEWKQRNLLAQATILAEKGRINWSTEELSAWNTGEALWQQIKSIRDCSDYIEKLLPIPQDFTADKYWTTK